LSIHSTTLYPHSSKQKIYITPACLRVCLCLSLTLTRAHTHTLTHTHSLSLSLFASLILITPLPSKPPSQTQMIKKIDETLELTQHVAVPLNSVDWNPESSRRRISVRCDKREVAELALSTINHAHTLYSERSVLIPPLSEE
jgi:hypothetical protein